MDTKALATLIVERKTADVRSEVDETRVAAIAEVEKEVARHAQLIEARVEDLGLVPDQSGWGIEEADERVGLSLGRWQVVTDELEDTGLFLEDEGHLVASVVGAPEHRNERVHIGLTPEGQDSPTEVHGLDGLEPCDD